MVCGVPGEVGVDWSRVRTSSSGETSEATIVRDAIPAVRGVSNGAAWITGKE